MGIAIGRWRPRHILVGWCAYWAGLAAVTLTPFILAVWRMSRVPNGHGNVNVGFGDGGLTGKVADGSRTLYSGSMSFLTLVLLAAGPPLLLWLVWLVSAARTNNADAVARRPRVQSSELQAADATRGIDTSTSKRPAREEL